MTKVLCIMNKIETLNFSFDSSLRLLWEGKRRGFELFYLSPENLSIKNGTVCALVQKILILSEEIIYDNLILSSEERIDLFNMDYILIRQDPPFDMNYITVTYLLEKISDKVKIINNPKAIRNFPEKLLVCDYPELMPPTIITSNLLEAKLFEKEYKQLVIKPLYAHGGADISLINNNLEEIFNLLYNKYKLPLILQKYLPEVKYGDKRIMIINGKPVGALLRVPPPNSIKSNIVGGGKAVKTTINTTELEICDKISDVLVKNGLYLAGIDVISGYITEINITSPTGFVPINKYNNIKLEKIFWDELS